MQFRQPQLKLCVYRPPSFFVRAVGCGAGGVVRGWWQLQRVEQEAEAARKTLGLQTEEDKKRAQFADELERKRHVDQVGFRGLQ